MDRQNCKVIRAILQNMGFLSYLQSTREIDDPEYDEDDNEIVIFGLVDLHNHDVTGGSHN